MSFEKKGKLTKAKNSMLKELIAPLIWTSLNLCFGKVLTVYHKIWNFIEREGCGMAQKTAFVFFLRFFPLNQRQISSFLATYNLLSYNAFSLDQVKTQWFGNVMYIPSYS